MKTLIRLGVATCLFAAGCAGSPESAGALENAGALEDEAMRLSAFSDAAPVAEERWRAAPAGCEGIRGATWRAAEGAPPLAVVTASDGSVLCVDTFDALFEDLASDLQAVSYVSASPAQDPEPQPAIQSN